MSTRGMKVSEVARRTGLTVRALHHYDALGLLSPSARTESGHRLYTDADLARLLQIVSLRQLGFGLEDIRRMLDDERSSLARVVELRLEAAHAEAEQANALVRKLEALSARLRTSEAPMVEELVSTLEVTAMYEKFFNPEQVQQLKAKAAKQGPGAYARAEADWKRAYADAKAARDRGASPSSPEMQDVAKRWERLIEDITDGDDGMLAGLAALYRADRDVAKRVFGPDADEAVLLFIEEARQQRKS